MNALRLTCLLPLLLLAVAFTAPPAMSETYVNLKGDFYFEYPDDWRLVDHRVVDLHLWKNKAGETTMDYEAVFAPVESVPFYNGIYFVLTVDTAGGAYTQDDIDSVLADMGGKFGQTVRYFPVADFLADMKSNEPSYDENNQTVTVVSDIVEQGEVIKKHLLAIKFYEKGIANFFFYAPTDLFEQTEPVLNQILQSFGSGNAEAMLPKEELKIADIDVDEQNSGDSPDDGFAISTAVPWILLVIIIIALIAIMIKRRAK